MRKPAKGQFLRCLSLMIAAIALCSLTRGTFISRPDIAPVQWNVTYAAADASSRLSEGLIFLAPRVVDPCHLAIYNESNGGDIVYYATPPRVVQDNQGAFNFRPQTYLGQPVLTYWEGIQAQGFGYGNVVMLANNYSVIANITIENGTDIHESRISRDNTLLVTWYNTSTGIDTSNITNGIVDSHVVDSCFKELSLPDGTELFNYCALTGGISVEESYLPIYDPPNSITSAWDYSHANTVDKDPLGNYLFSLRHAWMTAYIDGKTGEILWRLGGKQSNFTGNGTDFHWQHDTQFVNVNGQTVQATSGKRRISLFDNGGTGMINNETQSKGMLVEIDFAAKTATALTQYTNPGNETLLAFSQGNTQYFNRDDEYSPAPNGVGSNNVLMGYGYLPVFAEYAADGTPLQVVHWGESDYQSYRTYKAPWQGFPTTQPDIAINAAGTVYMSWNGATEVRDWRIIYGGNITSDDNVIDLVDPFEASVSRSSFETAALLNLTAGQLVYAVALDATGNELGRSATLNVTGQLLLSSTASANAAAASATAVASTAIPTAVVSTVTAIAVASVASSSTFSGASDSAGRLQLMWYGFHSGTFSAALVLTSMLLGRVLTLLP